SIHHLHHSTLSSSLLFTDPATPYIYTLSLHDALPIFRPRSVRPAAGNAGTYARALRRGQAGRRVVRGLQAVDPAGGRRFAAAHEDRKSTRLNSSHVSISYAVFCLKKKKIHKIYISIYF